MGSTKLPNFPVFSQANATAIAVAMKLLEEPNEVTSTQMLCKQREAIQRPSDRVIVSGTGDRSVPLGEISFGRISSYRLVVAAGRVKTFPMLL